MSKMPPHLSPLTSTPTSGSQGYAAEKLSPGVMTRIAPSSGIPTITERVVTPVL